MGSSIVKLISLLRRAERIRLLFVLLAMLGMGVVQMAGVGVILPFVSLLSNPERIQHSAKLHWVYETLGFANTDQFLIFVGVLLTVVLVLSNLIMALTLWLMTHFAWNIQKNVSIRLLAGYLRQPYEVFINRNSADIGKNILIESSQLANGVMLPALRVVAFGTTVLFIMGFLLWLNPLLAAGVTLIFGGAYLLVYLIIRRLLLRIGGRRIEANTARFKAVGEAFGSIKEVKVLGREPIFLGRYEPAARTFAAVNATNIVLATVPKFVIESLAFSMVMLVLLYLLSTGGRLQAALPVAAAFVLGGYRLLPALQQVYTSFAKWRFNHSVLDMLVEDMASIEVGQMAADPLNEAGDDVTPARLPFENAIELHNVGYSYPNAGVASLRSVTITIPRNSFTALTGATGAGKTTLADILLGLLEPSEGKICIDGIPLSASNRRCWQANLGYVPQDIYLTDSSLASNIAYGLEGGAIDMAAVERAARIANIHEFIVGRLPHGYETIVGERGVRLSGGQRQRVGIARALYHDPKVIVLDEATSALDNETERRIVDELDAMRGGRTLIVIAHRLSTVKRCNEVIMLKDGAVAARGSYDDLIHENREFSALARADSSVAAKVSFG